MPEEDQMKSNEYSQKQKTICRRRRAKVAETETFIMPWQPAVNVACSLYKAAADMALRYTFMEIVML